MITPAGCARLEALLRGADSGTAEKKAPAGVQAAAQAVLSGDRYHTLKVERIFGAQKLAAKTADGKTVTVITKTTLHWIPGMEIAQCEASTTTPGVFYYHGRAPRRRGVL